MSARATAIVATSSCRGRRSPRPTRNSLTTSKESFPPSPAMSLSSLLRTALGFRLGVRPHRTTAIADLFVQAFRRGPVFAHVPNFNPFEVSDHQDVLLEPRVVEQLLRHDQAALRIQAPELASGREEAHVPRGILGLARLLLQLGLDLEPAGHGVEAEAVLPRHGAGDDEKTLLVFGIGDEGAELGRKNQSVLLVDRVGEFAYKHRDYLLSCSILTH